MSCRVDCRHEGSSQKRNRVLGLAEGRTDQRDCANGIAQALTVARRGGEKGAEACEHLTDVIVARVPRGDAHLLANAPVSTTRCHIDHVSSRAMDCVFESEETRSLRLRISPEWSNTGR